uniref:HECT-type E3 ubiquitin transferase n=1 Tax=Ananas comosus var. bracteatus TaxID=296719 RepID=A0A6V7PK92_ANACO|nr:unnamed protein product [Ananas comosus var. bracteatus]
MPVFFDACQQAAAADLRRLLDGIAIRRGCHLRRRDGRRTSEPDDDDGGGGRRVIQIFVRTLSQGTVVVRAPASETVAAVHGRVERATGVPRSDLRLLHCGRQLSPGATLAAAGVQPGDTLHLSARLRSTPHPDAWRLAAAADAGGHSIPALVSLAAAADPRNVDFPGLYFSGAAAALVSLYNSTCPNVRSSAARVVRKLVSGSRGLPPLLFCHQLAAAVGTRDPLYRESRSAVFDLLKSLGPALAVQTLVPLVADTAASVLKDITILFDAPSPLLLDRLSDFLRLLEEALTATSCTDRSLEGLLSLIEEDRFYRMLHDALRILMDAFITILSTAGNVLKQQAGCSVGQRKLALCRQAVDVLTVVNNFAEIFPDFRPVLRATLSATAEPLDLLLRQAKRGTNLHWLLKCKDVAFSFEAKRNLVLMLLPEVGLRTSRSSTRCLSIGRTCLRSPSNISRKLALRSALRAPYRVQRKVFSPENVLFSACPADRRRFFPNPASSTDSMNLAYFKFSGRLIALALMHKVQIGITFDRTFFLQLAGKPITLEDVKDADPFLYESCKWILDRDPALLDSDALGLTFSRDVEVLGSIKNVELSTGGKDMVVNSTNRESYVNLLIEHSFVTSVAYQVEQFARGFADILSDRTHQRLFFESLELEDVDRLLYGSGGAISLTEWKQHTMYECYKEKDDQIQWFWKIIEEMSDEQRRVLLFFWTAVKYLPAEGFKGLNSKLCIHRAASPDTALPVSQTCFYRLSIPAYSSESTMRNRLQFITQEHVSCTFGMG